jgi:hypothetical protein
MTSGLPGMFFLSTRECLRIFLSNPLTEAIFISGLQEGSEIHLQEESLYVNDT